jgi:hypothetical protein
MPRTTVPQAPKHPWHSVSVVGGAEACAAAGELERKRFLSMEAPQLPLPTCSRPDRCQCLYVHYDDRRTSRRRGTDRGMFPSPRLGNERRVGQERRADDRE